jgi:hypothetical protein
MSDYGVEDNSKSKVTLNLSEIMEQAYKVYGPTQAMEDGLEEVYKAAERLAQEYNTNYATYGFKKTAYLETERYPEQTAAFEDIIQNMLDTYKMKMEDYSPWNMKGTGELGAITRLWDKTARLMNLMGFDIGTGKFTAYKDPKNESIDDTLLDLANYAIITMILRKGKWGK